MIKASYNDRAWVVDLLAASFKENQSVNYIILQDSRKAKRIVALMEYSFDMCMKFGEVWLSDDNNACALVLYPLLKRVTLFTVWLDIKLIFKAIGIFGIAKALKRESEIKKLQPTGDITYLWFIGVVPSSQHSGTGSQLMREIIQASDLKQLPVYLETSTLTNLPWYEKFGFEIYNKLDLSYTLFFLKRRVDKL